MATNTSEISVAQLDFDLIKNNLIEYFRSDPTFQDYEFEGSALNILMDILAYNTHINAVMANMSANEMFIDSAQSRQNIISIAKSLAYTPASKRSALAVVKLEFYNILGAPAYITIPAGTRFSTAQGTTFSTKETYLAYRNETKEVTDYIAENVEIYEGVFHSFNYTVNYTDPDQAFVIPSVDADMTSLIVKNIVGTVSTIFTLNENITLLTPSSEKYFLHETPNGFFEVTFGDNILGKKPINGSTVSLQYIISKIGNDANGIDSFSKFQQIDGYSTYNIVTQIKATGAAEAQSKESVAINAPKLYRAQNRAVVTEDYENFLLNEYPFIETMSVWGGEYNDPPIYGKIFFAIKPTHTEFLSSNLKTKIKDELIRKYNVVTVIPEILDPDYIYVLVDTDIQFSKQQTTLSENDINVLANTSIIDYFDTTTKKFNKPFYFSSLVRAIDNSNISIVNSLTDIKMMKKFFPIVGAEERREIKFSNAIVPNSIYSTFYNITGTEGSTAKQVIKDDGNGILYTENVITNDVVFSNIGSVNYETGFVELLLTVYSLPVDTLDLRIYCTPVKKNIIPGYNQIVLVDQSASSQDYNRAAGIIISVTAENIDYK